MSFLPQDYDGVPAVWGQYSKLEEWSNRFRVLSNAIAWNVYWNREDRPVRKKLSEEVDMTDVRINERWKKKVSHFWAFVVWDYQQESVCILELTKNVPLKQFQELISDEDFSNPVDYDIIISRTGKKKDTKYNLRAWKIAPMDDEIVKAYSEVEVNLEKLFTWEDPFGKE